MRRAVAVLGAYLAIVASGPAVAATPQLFSISVAGDGAQATGLPEYDPAEPIAVTVTDDARQINALTITALGPAGETIRAPISRAADGTFTGSLSLSDQGMWRLHLTSRVGTLSTDTSAVTLNVQTPPPSNAAFIGLAVGAGIFVIVGGSGFFVLRRALAARAAAEVGRAA